MTPVKNAGKTNRVSFSIVSAAKKSPDFGKEGGYQRIALSRSDEPYTLRGESVLSGPSERNKRSNIKTPVPASFKPAIIPLEIDRFRNGEV
jgi:hypothetical protein